MRGKEHPVIYSILSIFLIICVTICGILLYRYTLSEMLKDELVASLAEVSRQRIEVLKARMAGNMETMRSVATFVSDMDFSDIDEIVRVLDRENRQNAFSRMGFILPDGQVFTCDGYELDFSTRDFFHEALTGKNVITGVQLDNIDGTYVIVFATPIYKNGEVGGILYATNNTKVYDDMLSNSSFDGQGFSHIIASDGGAVLKSSQRHGTIDFDNAFKALDDALFFPGSSLAHIREDIAQGKSGVAAYELAGVPRYMNYAPTGINDWFILSIVPMSVVSEKSDRILNLTLLLCAVVFIVFVGLLVYILFLQRRSRKALYSLAFRDTLTGLPNEHKFKKDAEPLLKSMPKKSLVLFYFDIEKFKMINNTFGFAAGNAILRQIARILLEQFPENAVIARISSDNFAVLWNYADPESVEEKAREMVQCIEGIRTSGGVSITFRVALGLYYVTPGDTDITVCLDRARMAQAAVKGVYNHFFRVYDGSLSDRLVGEHVIEQEMSSALEGRQFEVYLQPKVSFVTGEVAGCEALIRWNHPVRGLLSPAGFIPVFEKNGFITQLDMFVFREVCGTIRRWIDGGFPVYPVAVNMSRAHLDSPDFIGELRRTIQAYGVSPDYIELEVTESAVFDNPPLFIQTMNSLKEIGFRISMDDFGTGYSSLNMLKDMPIDVLKLDKGFIAESEKSRIVVSSVIQMARRLSIEVVGEGVETEEQAIALREMGCDLGQGYVFARPMPVTDYEKLLTAGTV